MSAPEQWRPVVGHEGAYEVSNRGQVRSVDRTVQLGNSTKTIRGKVLKLRDFGSPHPRKAVTLYQNGKPKVRLVHHLVLEAFVGPRPPGMEGCHNNGDATENTPANLRWDTRASNIRDSVTHGTHKETRKTHCPKMHRYDAETPRSGVTVSAVVAPAIATRNAIDNYARNSKRQVPHAPSPSPLRQNPRRRARVKGSGNAPLRRWH